jgi:hypothetical protein
MTRLLPCLCLFAGCEPTGTRTFPQWQDTAVDDTAGVPDTGATSDTSADTGGDTGTRTTGVGGNPIPVGVGFFGVVDRVTGTPLGLDDTLEDTFVSGSFTYDRAVPDDEPTNAELGEYPHVSGSGPFALFFIGNRVLEGSGNPRVTIDLASDTFLYADGPQAGDPGGVLRVLEFEGVPDDTIQVVVSLNASSGTFVNDRQPAVFPLLSDPIDPGLSVSFTVEDDNGTLSLELEALVE